MTSNMALHLSNVMLTVLRCGIPFVLHKMVFVSTWYFFLLMVKPTAVLPILSKASVMG